MKNVSSVCSECFLSLPNINTVFCLMNQMLINAKYISYFFLCVWRCCCFIFWRADPRMEAAEYTQKKIVYLIQHRKLYHISWYIYFFWGGEKGNIICINLINISVFFLVCIWNCTLRTVQEKKILFLLNV